ncbi:MAG: PorT family protein [Bacteroidales bacterium]|nr:PorT family protein [Bacteroidales bacterium]
MKKLFILLLLAVTTLSATHAQVRPEETVVVPSNKQSHFSIGLLGGIDRNYHIVDMSYMADYKYSPYAPGATYGLQIGVSPWKWLTLRVDGMIVDKNIYRDHVVSGTNMSFPDTARNQYVNVPVMLMFNMGKVVRLHAFGGAYLGYWLSSRHTGRSMGVFGNPSYDQTIDFSSSESQLRDNRADRGFVWGGGLSVVIKRHFEIGGEVRWYYGTEDMQKPYMTNLNPRYNTTFAIQGGVSYLF